MATDASACRIIYPRPWPPPYPWPPPHPRPRPQIQPITTRFHSADVTIRDQVAEVEVNATFYNPNNVRMEGTYWFPLPAQAAVRDFKMEINGKMVQGELLDAKKARKVYEDIVRKMKDPGLLEWVGGQMLKCRVFPMEPHKETKVSLTYTQMLRQDSGLVRFDYPLRSAKPNAGDIGQLVFKVHIQTTVPLKTIHSGTHAFDITRKGDKAATLTLEAKNVDPKRDVEIVFSRDARDVGLSVLTHKPKREDGTFLLTVTPKVEVDKSKVLPKDIVFVCDTSGSMMADNKLAQAKKALKFCVGSLNEGDRFGIITFSGDVRYFKKELVVRRKSVVEEANEFIDGLKAIGGTALNDAVLAALELTKKAESVPMIIFLTDGNPTIGEQNVETILKNARKANEKDVRLFVFGVGYDVNTKLLDLLAEENHGTREYVKPKEDIEVRVSGFYQKVSNPVLADVKLNFGDVDVEQLYPKKLPDLFHGGQITVLGRYKKPGTGNVVLTGTVGKTKKEFRYPVTFSDDTGHDYLPRMWALRKVAFLLDEIRLRGEKQEVVDEVTRLGKLHGIITPYTSFLVVEEGAPMTASVRRELRDLAHASREGFAKGDPGGGGRGAVWNSADIARAKSATPGAPRQTGRSGAAPTPDDEAGIAAPDPVVLGITGGAFGRDGRADDKMAEELEQRFRKAARELVHRVASKTFYARADGFWVDSTYDAKTHRNVEDVKLWSDAFLALAEKHKDLGKYVTAHQKLLVVLDGTAYRIQ
jgi:Ca-activated chloride channel family protein